jgi:hypothetical protein
MVVIPGCWEWAPNRTEKAATIVIRETAVMVGTAGTVDMGFRERLP